MKDRDRNRLTLEDMAMSDKVKPDRAERVDGWSKAPAVNPAYGGATPVDVARALLGKPPLRSSKTDNCIKARE